MDILGISCFYHDAAAALLRDGVLIAATEEERFSRRKHDFDFPDHAIDFCLQMGGITGKELDYVVFYEKPLVKLERILVTATSTYPRSWRAFREAMVAWLSDKLWIKEQLVNKLGITPDRVLFCDHHLSHAASAFYASPFEEAAILTVDGVGEWTTTTLGLGRAAWNNQGRNEITLFQEQRFPHSLGLLYSAFTAFLGFEVNEGEYKVMGMAPYGEPRFVDDVYKVIQVDNDGSFWIDMKYMAYHYSARHSFSRAFVDLFGDPRSPRDEFVTRRTHPRQDIPESVQTKNQRYADVAASIQTVTEETLLRIARSLHERTGQTRLCMAGGVALNSVANGRILRETPFEELFIQPAAGDSGGALGAALWAYHSVLNQPRKFIMEHAYYGAAYDGDAIHTAVANSGLPSEQLTHEDALQERVVDALLDGKVVAIFQGRAEWGPRALGNRSILADPRSYSMKDTVNLKIKFREPFRPFAPAIPEERAEEFFDFPGAAQHYPPRFMLMVTPVKEDKRAVIPAVTHEGGTGRIQTIRRELNPRYYGLIERFGEATGVPVLLNTSFNLRGEPIVNSPENALSSFMRSGIDLLVLDNVLVSKADTSTTKP